MAKDATHWEGRRALSDNPNTTSQNLQKVGRTLMDLDQLSEACQFFSSANDTNALLEILEKAIYEGNFFLFQSACAKLDTKPSISQVKNLIAAAEKGGRLLYAEKAKEFLKTL